MVGLLLWVLAGAAAGAVFATLFTNPPPELRVRALVLSVIIGMVVASTLWELLLNRDNLADS
jgi:hypothetical protein